MSGVLHPVGPEPTRTYWIRRGILLAVVLLLALGVVFTVANLTRAAVATAPPPAVLPADTPSPSAPTSSTASRSAATSPGASGTSAGTPGVTPSPSATVRTSPSPSVSPSASAPATPSTPAAKPSVSASANPKPTQSTVGTPDCRPADLRVTLQGDKSLAAGSKNEFRLTLVNRGAQTCLVSVTDRNLELKIYSGKDRIWSSRDCSKVLADFDKKLAAGADVDWTMTWNGRRSVEGEKCENAPQTPRPGIYWATAQLKGADPVQLRMTLS